MRIIKDNQINDNTWTYVCDGDELKDGDISVSLARWERDRTQLLERTGRVGVRLSSTDDVADLAKDLDKISLIELDFPAFTDGRGFSQARLLRQRHHYKGEIRAVGRFIADQAFYMHRVGIDSFALENTGDQHVALAALKDFSVRYQPSSN